MNAPPPVRTEILGRVASVAARISALGWGAPADGNLSLVLSGSDLCAPFAPVGEVLYPGTQAGEGGARTLLPERFAAAEGWPADRYLLISTAGSRWDELARDPAAGLCLVGASPAAAGESAGRRHPARLACLGAAEPSSELPVHLAAQWRREPGSALIHAHAAHLIALCALPALRGEGALERALAPLLRAAGSAPGLVIQRLRHESPGGVALASRSAAALREADVLVWDRHGALARGRGLAEALSRLEQAEGAARRCWLELRDEGAAAGPTRRARGKAREQRG